MKLYYSPGACSLASHIVLEESGLPYEAVRVTVADRSNWRPEYLAVNPRGYVPALAVDDWVMTENAAIMLLIARQRPEAGLLPDPPRELARCLEWLAWQTNTAHIAFAQHWRAERFVDDPTHYPVVQGGAPKRIRTVLGEIEAWLKDHEHAAGTSYSIADPMFLVIYRWGWRVGETMGTGTFPAWTDYVRRLSERPAVRRVLEQEGVSLLPG